jgi:hypothetical protein
MQSVGKGEGDFAGLYRVQELVLPQLGAIWTMKFSVDGRLLAVAGQVWIARSTRSIPGIDLAR